MNSQQPHQGSQHMYGYQAPLRKQVPNFTPGVNMGQMMMGPQVNAHMGQQQPELGLHPTARQGHVQYSGAQISVPQPRKQQQQVQPQSQSNDLSNSTSAIPSPFATSMPTPTGPASAPPMNMHVGAPVSGAAQMPGATRSAGPVSATASTANHISGPGLTPASPQVGAMPSNQFYPVASAYQPVSKRHIASNMIPYPIRKYLSNMAILRLHEIINLVNVSTDRVDDFGYWQRFTNDLFTPYGILRYSTQGGEETRQFEFTTPIIPLICNSLGSVGIVRLEMIPQQLRAQVLSNGTIFFDCPRCTTTFYYPDGSYMTNFSQVKGIFDSNLKIEWVEISSYSFVPGIEWSSLERLISSEPVCHEIFKDLSNSRKKPESTEDPKNQEPARNQDPKVPDNFSAITKLRSQFGVFHNISSFGIQESFMRALQVSDVISYLKNLKVYQKVHNLQSPLTSLESFVASSQAEKASSMAPGAPFKYGNSSSPAATPSNPRPKVPNSSKPRPKKRRQSDLSPLSTGDRGLQGFGQI